jgi:hypothetical protein
VAFGETPSLQKRKRRRIIQSKDLVDSESLWKSVVRNLDILYQAQLNHQRTTTTTVGKIEIENRRLIAQSREFQDSQMCRQLKEGFKDQGNHARTLVTDLVEDLLSAMTPSI